MDKPRIIIFDIETLPNLKEALKHWPKLSNYPGRTLKATVTSVACFGWKRYGRKRTHCLNAWDFKNWNKDVNDDSRLVKEIHKILSQADTVVSHNGKKFDWRFLQTRFVKHGLPPLHNIHHVDTCEISRRNLYSIDNRLNTIGELLADDNKLENGGWQLWVDVHNKKKSAMNLMVRYCKQDVDLLEKCFIKLIPLIKNLPNWNNYRSDKKIREGTQVCPNCGSTELKRHGWRYTSTMVYMRLICKSCGTHSRTDVKGYKPRTF